jgi:hypothetical protein
MVTKKRLPCSACNRSVSPRSSRQFGGSRSSAVFSGGAVWPPAPDKKGRANAIRKAHGTPARHRTGEVFEDLVMGTSVAKLKCQAHLHFGGFLPNLTPSLSNTPHSSANFRTYGARLEEIARQRTLLAAFFNSRAAKVCAATAGATATHSNRRPRLRSAQR